MAERPSADVFGTFLEAVKNRSTAQQKRSGGDWLLTRLHESGQQSIPDLLASGSLGLTDFTAMLTAMQDAGLVALEGPPGREVVTLTPAGQQAASSMS